MTVSALVILSGAAFADNNIYIICNPNVKVDTLSSKEIKEIFLGRQKRWKDNKEIEFVIMDKTASHKLFIKKYLNKNPIQFRHWWRKQAFTGEGMMPRSFTSEKKMMEYVSKKDGTIGYASSDAVTNSRLKILKIYE